MKKILSLMAMAALLTLSACGGDSKIGFRPPTTPTQPTTPTTPPVSVADAFFAAVLRMVGDGSESSAEPVATDSIAATAPDDTEPSALN